MAVKDRFLKEVKIGDRLILMIGSKEMEGLVVALDLDTVRIRKENGKEPVVSLDSVSFYEISDEEIEINPILSSTEEPKIEQNKEKTQPEQQQKVSNAQEANKENKETDTSVFAILSSSGDTYFDNISAPNVKGYAEVAYACKKQNLNAIANSLDYAFKQNHESSPADYTIHGNIRKLSRLINGVEKDRNAANMLGALYYQCKSDRLAIDAYKQGNDYVSAFIVAQSISSAENMEYFACRHFIEDTRLDAFIVKWLVERMIESDDYSVISRINSNNTFPEKTRGYIATLKAIFIANNIQHDTKHDLKDKKQELGELLHIFMQEIIGSGQKMKEYVQEPVILAEPIEKPTAECPKIKAATQARQQEKNFDKAEQLYLEAIRENERPTTAAAELVGLMMQKRDLTKAAEYLVQYGSKYMREAAYKNVRAQLINMDARLAYKISRKENIKAEQDYFILAQKAELEEKDLQKAITYYKQAIDKSQRLSGSIPNLVSLYTRLEMYEEALTLLDDAGKKNMSKAKYLNLRLSVFSTAKDKKYKAEIIETYSQAFNLTISEVKRIDLILSKASLMNQLGEYNEAIKSFTKCRKLMKDGGHFAPDKEKSILLGLCAAYYKLNNYNVATEYAEKILKILPDNEFAKSVISGQVTEDMEYVDDYIGVSKISEFIMQRIAKLSLENELKHKRGINEGLFTGTPEEAERLIYTIKAQFQTSVNDEIKSKYCFAIAKLIRQILDRDEEIEQTKLLTEPSYQYEVARGSYYYGNYRTRRTELTHSLDTARYCFFESIRMLKDNEKLNKYCAASTIRYTETYFYSTEDIKIGAKVLSDLFDIDDVLVPMQDRISKTMQRKICTTVGEFVVGMLEMLTYNSKIKQFMLKNIYAMGGRIFDVLSRIGETEIPDSIKFNTFMKIWELSSKKYYAKRESFLRIIEETVDSVFVIGQLQENYNRFIGSEFQSYLNQTDKEYAGDLQLIFAALQRYNEESEFDYKADTLGRADEIRKRLEEKIADNPTYISFEKLLPMLRQLQAKILKESAQLYGNSEPIISVKLAGNCSVDESRIVHAPIAFSNKNNVQNADNVVIKISGDGVEVINDDKLSRGLLPGDGKAQEKLIAIQVTPEILKSQVFTVDVEIEYQYKMNMTETKDAKIKLVLPINLYSDSTFEPIENKFEPYRNGSEVKEKSMFYGREKDIESIIQQISDESGNILRGRCLALYGQTRTGKSSLLYHLENRLREINEEGNVIINVGSIGEENLAGNDITDFLYTLLDELDNEIKRKHPRLMSILLNNEISIDAQKLLDNPERSQLYFNDVFKKINRCLEDEGQNYNIIVMIDEFTYIYDWIRRGIMTDRIMKFWKAFIQNNEIFAIIIGQDHMMKFVEEKQFTNDFGSTDLRKVTYLPEEDAKKLMYEPIMLVKESGEKKNRYQEGALDRLYELTAGSAFLIMNLCAGLVNYLNDTKTAFITRAHVDEYLKQNLSSFEEARFFEPQYDDKSNTNSDEANNENKRILHRIAQLSNKKEWTPLRSVIKSDRDRELIDALEQRDVIIVSNGDRCKIKVALYKEWIIAKYGLEGSHE